MKKKNRKKVNFMLDNNIIVRFFELVPAGERSDFANKALSDAILHFGRQKASHEIDKVRKTLGWRMTDAEIRKAIRYGRE